MATRPMDGRPMDTCDTGALNSLLTRHSVPALNLREPGPEPAQIDAAVDAAARAPDHGQLRPLRLVLIRGAARARLSELFVRCMQAQQPPPPPAKIDKARRMPLTAPLVIVLAAQVRAGVKVPELEQLLAAGAGVMNLLQAFHAQGFGAIWLTGPNAYDPQVARALGFEATERCLGFLYVGSVAADAPLPAVSPAALAARPHMVRDWNG